MTFSNPRYDVMQTAPYQTENNGHPISAACVGAVSPVEENATLEPPDDLDTPPAGGGGGGGEVPTTIGPVTVSGDASPTVGDTVTYTATQSGTATDVQFTFSAPGETFTGGTVTWANDGATTVTATATSATANNSPQTGTRAVTVAPAGGGGGGTVSFTSFTSTSISNGQALGSNSVFHFNGSPNGCTGSNTSPQLSWAVDDDTNVDTYRVTCNDITNPWLHWEFEVLKTTTSVIENVAAGDLGDIQPNDWASNGITGSNANGWGGPCPPGGTHTYRLRVEALDNAAQVLATSDPIDFTAS